MKSKKLLLACALSAITLSYNAFSQESSSVCLDPLKRVCKDTVEARKQRAVYVNQIKAEINQAAKPGIDARVAEMKKNVPARRFIKRLVQEFKIKNQEIMRVAKTKVVGLEEIVTSKENVALLKSYMKEAIDESQFDETTKVNFKSTIDSIVIGNFADFLERTGLEDNVLAQLLNNACGSDGLVDNAFATTFNNEKYVLVCPGFLISMSQTPDLRERFDSVLHAISHEMGHHIDNSKVGNEYYKPFMSCLADNYSDKFNKTKEDDKFCKANVKDPNACKEKVTLSHAGELIADAWGLKVLGIHAKKQNYSSIETDTLLVNSWSKLCGTGDEGIHPSGDFRIGTLLRTNPELSTYMACDNRSVNSKPACTLEGAVNL